LLENYAQSAKKRVINFDEVRSVAAAELNIARLGEIYTIYQAAGC